MLLFVLRLNYAYPLLLRALYTTFFFSCPSIYAKIEDAAVVHYLRAHLSQRVLLCKHEIEEGRKLLGNNNASGR